MDEATGPENQASPHVSGTRPPKRPGFLRKTRISAVSVPAKVHG